MDKKTNHKGLSPIGKIQFSDFEIQNPEIPAEEGAMVSLVDEEISAVNIQNLTLSECRQIIGALDSIVIESVKNKKNQSLKFAGDERNINFTLVYVAEDGRESISITGRDIEGTDDSGSYCHDFEINGITIDDWNKIKSLIQK